MPSDLSRGSKDGRTSRCRGSTSSPLGWSTQSASAARAGSRELLATPTYFVVVVGFLAVAVAGGVAGFEAITGVSVPPASTERQSAGS